MKFSEDMGTSPNNSGSLAQSITRSSSKQTYYTARVMVDRDKVEDFLRAYAYFRWADDVIDIFARTRDERISFIERQKTIIDGLYDRKTVHDLGPEEQMIADLIRSDNGQGSGLQSFIRNMLAIIEFDAHRVGKLVSREELAWYTKRVGKSVTDGILYFVGNGHSYAQAGNKYLAAEGAHITHLLRDMVVDTSEGFINIPSEYLARHNINPKDVDNPLYRTWVRERVQYARNCFAEGKVYLDRLDVLRAKIVGHWYCARFESVLDTIEREDYLLRENYGDGRNISAWLNIVAIAVRITAGHLFTRLRAACGSGL